MLSAFFFQRILPKFKGDSRNILIYLLVSDLAIEVNIIGN
jgi:hypothetical protein